MLAKPEHGWTEIHIGEFTGWGSSIQDVPILFLETFIRALTCISPAEVKIDEEGSFFTLRAGQVKTILLRPGASESIAPSSTQALSWELLRDLRRDFDLWVQWRPDESPERRAAHLEREMGALQRILDTEGGRL